MRILGTAGKAEIAALLKSQIRVTDLLHAMLLLRQP